MNKQLELICPICDGEMEVICSGHARKPFIDGRIYKIMCHCCFEVPKMWKIDILTGRAEILKEFNENHLSSVEELMEEGFNKKEATRSIKAVKRAIKSNKG